MLTALDPLALCIDLGLSPDGGDHSRRRHLNFTRFFNDPLQRRSDVSPSLLEQPEGMSMPINRSPVGNSIPLGDTRRAFPIDESHLDPLTLFICTNRALNFVPGAIHMLLFRNAFECSFYQRVLRACQQNAGPKNK